MEEYSMFPAEVGTFVTTNCAQVGDHGALWVLSTRPIAANEHVCTETALCRYRELLDMGVATELVVEALSKEEMRACILSALSPLGSGVSQVPPLPPRACARTSARRLTTPPPQPRRAAQQPSRAAAATAS